MAFICPELNDLIFLPPSDLEPDDCFVNKLRRMETEEREQKLASLNFVEQLKIARTHKVCIMLNHTHKCIFND
jgi:hypothetical protein